MHSQAPLRYTHRRINQLRHSEAVYLRVGGGPCARASAWWQQRVSEHRRSQRAGAAARGFWGDSLDSRARERTVSFPVLILRRHTAATQRHPATQLHRTTHASARLFKVLLLTECWDTKLGSTPCHHPSPAHPHTHMRNTPNTPNTSTHASKKHGTR